MRLMRSQWESLEAYLEKFNPMQINKTCAFLTEYSNAKTNKWYEKHFTTKDETVTNEDIDETI